MGLGGGRREEGGGRSDATQPESRVGEQPPLIIITAKFNTEEASMKHHLCCRGEIGIQEYADSLHLIYTHVSKLVVCFCSIGMCVCVCVCVQILNCIT